MASELERVRRKEHRTRSELVREALRSERSEFDTSAQKLGYALGSELYVTSARATGLSHRAVIWRHLAPRLGTAV